jgi:DMSO/TMAO reductase YedYZ molybdopterin-dependent catalytic subunit
MAVTRGFTGRPRRGGDDRLPPGQYDTGAGWPTLTAELTPQVDVDTWTMTVDGLVDTPTTWDWRGVHALPGSTYFGDIHCVTTWTKLDTQWTGVSVDTLLDGVDLEGGYITALCDGGYTTNLPVEDVTGGKAWVVYSYDGDELEPEHGGPARLLVPHLYFWKSAKWVRRLIFTEDDEPGFWEQLGYHDRGDPWLEQRYQGD